MQDQKNTKRKPRMFRVVETLVNNKTIKLIVPCKKNTEENFSNREGFGVYIHLDARIRKALCMYSKLQKIKARIFNLSFSNIPEYEIVLEPPPDNPFMFTEVDIHFFPCGSLFQEIVEVVAGDPKLEKKESSKKKSTALGIRKTPGPFFVGGKGDGPTGIDDLKKAAQDYYDDLT